MFHYKGRVASQSWQHMPLLPAASAQGRIRHLPHLTRAEEPTMRSHEAYQWLLRSGFFFFPISQQSKEIKLMQMYTTLLLQTLEPGFGVGIAFLFRAFRGWGWPSFFTYKLECNCGIHFTLIPTNTLETMRGQHATLNRDEYKVLVFCWVLRQTANIILNNVWY